MPSLGVRSPWLGQSKHLATIYGKHGFPIHKLYALLSYIIRYNQIQEWILNFKLRGATGGGGEQLTTRIWKPNGISYMKKLVQEAFTIIKAKQIIN